LTNHIGVSGHAGEVAPAVAVRIGRPHPALKLGPIGTLGSAQVFSNEFPGCLKTAPVKGIVSQQQSAVDDPVLAKSLGRCAYCCCIKINI